jgi:protein-S-isoprenylcysteine O-methyltransferase Ste14
LFVIPDLAVLATRILDEEKVLSLQLTGYLDYAQRVHYRLVPYVW